MGNIAFLPYRFLVLPQTDPPPPLKKMYTMTTVTFVADRKLPYLSYFIKTNFIDEIDMVNAK